MPNKLNVDFSVYSDPYHLKIVDLSAWELIENLPSIIEITLPGYENYITKYFDKHKVNIHHSISLGVNCEGECGEVDKVTLPDGIYKIKVIGSPSTYNKESFYLKTDLFDMEIDKVIIDYFNTKNKNNFIDKLTQVEFLMKGAQAHLRFDDISTAGKLFEQAQQMVEDLKECKSCK